MSGHDDHSCSHKEEPSKPAAHTHAVDAHGVASADDDCCGPPKRSFDYLFWGSVSVLLPAYILGIYDFQILSGSLITFTATIVELVHRMWWGVALGIVAVGILHDVPREFVIAMLGRKGGLNGLFRAVAAGIFLDLCSHGILLVGMKLYERGATLGQVIAFLVASPWNSFSLTLVLIALIGFKWTLAFIFLSAVIAVISGWIFDKLTERGTLDKNPHRIDLPDDFHLMPEAKKALKGFRVTPAWLKDVLLQGIKDSRMLVRWFLFGIILASLIRAFVDTSTFAAWFGPTLAGLGLTILAATIIEVCSEGSTPIAADLLTRADAPGNGFAFLMTGVATDYTEMVTLKETTGRWKTALFLPLVTVPQVLLISYALNVF